MEVTFKYIPKEGEEVRRVDLMGTFNKWRAGVNPMNFVPEKNLWETTLDLPAGVYEYKFLVNNSDWYHDPYGRCFIENEVGSLNTLIKVGEENTIFHASFYPIKPTIDDKITIYSRKSGAIIWSLNGWNPYPRGYLHKTIQDLAVNVYRMERSPVDNFYQYTLGPFNKGIIPELIVYSFIFEDAQVDDNVGKKYYLPLDLKLGGNTVEDSFFSKYLKIEKHFRVYLPKGYSAENYTPYPAVYLIHGYGGSWKGDWLQTSIVKKMADKYNLLLVWPDGNVKVGNKIVPGWYINSPVVDTAKMESYIIKELIPYVERKYNASSCAKKRAIGGISMGGFGAMYLGTKYNRVFKVIASMSAIYNLYQYKELPDVKTLIPDEEAWDAYTFNAIELAKYTKNTNFYFIVGDEERGALKDNFLLKINMMENKLKHEFHLYPGAHNNNFWRVHLQEMMEFIGKHLTEDVAKTTKLTKSKANGL